MASPMEEKDPYQPQALYHGGVPCGKWCSAPPLFHKPRYIEVEYARYLCKPERPLAEPPMFDYDTFFEENIPSDIRMKILIPNDIESRTRYRYVVTEIYLFEMYTHWCRDVKNDLELDTEKRTFYDQLYENIDNDWNETEGDFQQMNKQLSMTDGWNGIRQWEFRYMDQDGGTEGIRKALEEYADIFGYGSDQERQVLEARYQHLAPSDYFSKRAEKDLKEWEEQYLSENPDTAVARLHQRIAEGDHVFRWREGEEGWKKYGYLETLPYSPKDYYGDTFIKGELEGWESRNVPGNTNTSTSLARLHQRIAGGANVFQDVGVGEWEARKKYGYLETLPWDPAVYYEGALPTLFGDIYAEEDTDEEATSSQEAPINHSPAPQSGAQASDANAADSPGPLSQASTALPSRQFLKLHHLQENFVVVVTAIALFGCIVLEVAIVYQAWKEWMVWL